MKMIMENWRGFLQEGRYEAATTELTRKVIPHVKYIIKEVIPSDGVQNSRKDLILVVGATGGTRTADLIVVSSATAAATVTTINGT